MTQYRTEHDLLGNKEVPKDAYYGIQTLRAKENFPITGLKPHKNIFRCLGAVKKAAAKANAELGLLDEKVSKAIIKASEEVQEGKFDDEFIVDAIQGGAGTSINMNVNEVIANRANELLGGEKGKYDKVHPNTHVNMAQSTNDAFPTAFRLAILTEVKGLLEELELLHKTLLEKSKEFDDVVKVGRTHLQDAVPIRLGQEFGAYAKAISRDIARIKNAVDPLHEINIGATAVGTGLNATYEYIDLAIKYIEEATNIKVRGVENLVDGTQNLDTIAAFSSTLKVLAISLSKIANDLRLMTSGPRAGLNEINLPAVQPGSSIMPGKVNPVMAEVVNQVAFQVIGNDHTISLAVEAGQFELNVMEPVAAFNLMQSIDILTNVTRVFREKCIKGITANKERCKNMVESHIGIITALNPHIGYEQSSSIAKEAKESGEKIPEIVARKGILTKEQLDTILDPKNLTEPGIVKIDK